MIDKLIGYGIDAFFVGVIVFAVLALIGAMMFIPAIFGAVFLALH